MNDEDVKADPTTTATEQAQEERAAAAEARAAKAEAEAARLTEINAELRRRRGETGTGSTSAKRVAGLTREQQARLDSLNVQLPVAQADEEKKRQEAARRGGGGYSLVELEKAKARTEMIACQIALLVPQAEDVTKALSSQVLEQDAGLLAAVNAAKAKYRFQRTPANLMAVQAASEKLQQHRRQATGKYQVGVESILDY